MKPTVGITMGDPSGIGPEIIIKTINDGTVNDYCTPIVIGDKNIIQRDIDRTELDIKVNIIKKPSDAITDKKTVNIIDLDLLSYEFEYGLINAKSGNAAYKYVEKAVELAISKEISAICTAPLNKEALHLAGFNYPGHTEILAELTNTKNYSMMLSCPDFKVIHLTTHLGLIEAIEKINPERTYEVIKLAHDTLNEGLDKSPKIAVCGINPHAGEGGIFGNKEEENKLTPGIMKAKEEGLDVEGPLAADTLFYRAKRKDFDVVVACYHDQGHIPVKVLGLDEGVNITVGLNYNIIRTSVDHGTAFDIAGKNMSSHKSMEEAIKVAIDLIPK